MTSVYDIYSYFDSIAPFLTQEEWDNSGILVGCDKAAVTKAVLCLDVTKSIVRFASDIGAELIISHHPVIFGGIKSVKSGDAVYECVKNGIAVLSAHTCFDKAANGINTNLCKRLGLFDVHPVDGTFIVTGKLDKPMSADDFAQYVSDSLDVHGLRYTDSDLPIKTVAVGGGACEEYLPQAMDCADCFVTGDMKYHDFLAAAENNYCVISAGHFETESESFHMLLGELQSKFPNVEFVWGEQKNPVLAV